MKRSSGMVVRALAVLSPAFSLAACGGLPRDYNEVAEAEQIDLPEEESEAPADGNDGGVDAAVDTDHEIGAAPLAVGMTAIPALPIARVLGKARDDIETLFTTVGADESEKEAGWVRYNQHLEVRYDESDLAVELAHRVPEDLGCLEAARWLGFEDADPPRREEGSCVWPAGSDDHSLAEDASGRLVLDAELFTARRESP
ncbi:MAG: hypothetical protein R6V85_16650 [Polyangia bacterium]